MEVSSETYREDRTSNRLERIPRDLQGPQYLHAVESLGSGNLQVPVGPLGPYPRGLMPLKWKTLDSATFWALADAEGSYFYRNLTRVDVSKLAARIEALRGLGEPPHIWTPEGQSRNAFFEGRKGNQETFKPGCSDIKFIFSSNDGKACFEFPWWQEWKDDILPLLEGALGEGIEPYILRVQLARMGPGATINPHIDTGDWARFAHRIHIPLKINEDVVFSALTPRGYEAVVIEEGLVFEINNLIKHKVSNSQTKERIHLLLDLKEHIVPKEVLQPGTTCAYGAMNKMHACIEPGSMDGKSQTGSLAARDRAPSNTNRSGRPGRQRRRQGLNGGDRPTQNSQRHYMQYTGAAPRSINARKRLRDTEYGRGFVQPGGLPHTVKMGRSRGTLGRGPFRQQPLVY